MPGQPALGNPEHKSLSQKIIPEDTVTANHTSSGFSFKCQCFCIRPGSCISTITYCRRELRAQPRTHSSPPPCRWQAAARQRERCRARLGAAGDKPAPAQQFIVRSSPSFGAGVCRPGSGPGQGPRFIAKRTLHSPVWEFGAATPAPYAQCRTARRATFRRWLGLAQMQPPPKPSKLKWKTPLNRSSPNGETPLEPSHFQRAPPRAGSRRFARRRWAARPTTARRPQPYNSPSCSWRRCRRRDHHRHRVTPTPTPSWGRTRSRPAAPARRAGRRGAWRSVLGRAISNTRCNKSFRFINSIPAGK